MHARMYLPDTKYMAFQTNYGIEQYNALNINCLMKNIARFLNSITYFDLAQHKYSYTTCSDAMRGHLMGSSCPGNKIQVDSISHVENAGSHNRFGGRHSAW